MLIEIYSVVDVEKNNNAFNPDFRTFFDTDEFTIVTQDIDGNVIGTAPVGDNIIDNLTADPSQTQAGGTLLGRSTNIVRTAAANGDSLLLPDDYPLNIPLQVINITVRTLNVFPPVGGIINKLAVNMPQIMLAGLPQVYVRTDVNQWIVLSFL